MEDDDNEGDDAYMNNGLIPGKNNNKRGRGTSSSFQSREWADRNDDTAAGYGDDDMDIGQGRGAKQSRKNSSFGGGGGGGDDGGFGNRSSSSSSSGGGGGNNRRNSAPSALSEFVREKKNEKRASLSSKSSIRK